MPKRFGNLWEDIVSYENLFKAFKKVRLGKRFHAPVLKVYYNLDDHLFDIQERLKNHTWKPAPFREFWIQETKPRFISAPAVQDRIVHWALMLQVGSLFERRFIDHSYACRVAMGAHLASTHAQEMLRSASGKWGKPYILKGDVSKYFPSIDQAVLMKRVERIVSDKNVLWLFDTIIKNNAREYGIGIPIGSLTSQWLANLYLDAFDHFIKDDIGAHYYLRYMDDFVLIGPNKEWCKTILEQAEGYLNCVLHLRLNPKTAIFPASHGLDFVGYRHWTDHILPRKRTVQRAKKQFKSLPARYAKGEIDLEYIRPRVASFAGYMGHCNGYKTLEHILENLVLVKGEDKDCTERAEYGKEM